MTMLNFIKKLIPESAYQRLQSPYHFGLGFLAALVYGFPSRRMTVVGVTGTKGKTTTCNLIAQIFEEAGFKTGLATTVNFKIGEKEWVNDKKQTMLGRFALQKFLRDMVRAGCTHAVIETSSEGILQYRHRFIDYDAAVFTNITPEHLERHGGFLNYRAAKVRLFELVARKKDGAGIYNMDDPNAGYFLEPEIKNKYGYGKTANYKPQITNKFLISNIILAENKTEFEMDGEKFEMPLVGKFNVYNAAAAVCAAISQGIPIAKIKSAIAKAKSPAGRFEVIKSPQGFRVVIDYAHEPASLRAVYEATYNLKPTTNNQRLTTNNQQSAISNGRLICLLGSQGGGRDKWKRAEMGRIAGEYCDEIILANEDPYDENPFSIIEDIEKGFLEIPNPKSQITKIIDRKEAIKKAVSIAKENDVVIITGKGGEVSMCIENGKVIPWSDREIVETLIYRKPLISD